MLFYNGWPDIFANTAEIGGTILFGIESIGAGVARWAVLEGHKRLAYFGIGAEMLGLSNSTRVATKLDDLAPKTGDAAQWVVDKGRYLKPEMKRVNSGAGKPKFRVDKNGNPILE